MSFWGSLDVININILQSSTYKNNSQFTPWQNEVLILHKKWLQILKGHFKKKNTKGLPANDDYEIHPPNHAKLYITGAVPKSPIGL